MPVSTTRILPLVHAGSSPAHNVIAGWLGHELPDIPRQRNKSRAAYRKTNTRRTRRRAPNTSRLAA